MWRWSDKLAMFLLNGLRASDSGQCERLSKGDFCYATIVRLLLGLFRVRDLVTGVSSYRMFDDVWVT